QVLFGQFDRSYLGPFFAKEYKGFGWLKAIRRDQLQKILRCRLFTCPRTRVPGRVTWQLLLLRRLRPLGPDPMQKPYCAPGRQCAHVTSLGWTNCRIIACVQLLFMELQPETLSSVHYVLRHRTETSSVDPLDNLAMFCIPVCSFV